LKSILYTKSFSEDINESVNVILSPEFYWIKKIDLNIPLKDLKKIAKTKFKLNEKEYVFDAFKLNNKSFIVAFKKDLDLKIPKKYINSIRIAQIEFFDYDCIDIDENKSLQKIDDLIFLLPKTKECKKINDVLKEIKLSNKKFNLINKLNLDKTVLILGVLIFILLNTSILIQTLLIKKEISLIKSNREKFLSSHNLPKTNIQLTSILNSLENEYKTQINLKKSLEYITKTPLKNDEYFKKLQYDSKTFKIEVKTSKNLDNYFKKKFNVTSSYKNNVYKATLK
jgi:hypothetical protein